MEELVKEGDEMAWKETARWIKFEEDVEEGGNRWSKPHVATLSLHSLFELRSLLLNGTVMLDMEASGLEQIAELVCENMVNAGTLPIEARDKVIEALLKRHKHQHEFAAGGSKKSRLPLIRSLADIGKNHSSSKSKSKVPVGSTLFLESLCKYLVCKKIGSATKKKVTSIIVHQLSTVTENLSLHKPPTVQCDIYIPGRYAPLIHRHLRQLIPNARRLIVTRNARRWWWRGRGHPAVPTNRTARWIGQRSAGSLSCTANRYLCSTPHHQ